MLIARRQASFGAGEFSPRAAGRTDLPQYAEGMLQQQNWITHAQGSLTRRPGMQHVGAGKTVASVVFTERANPKNFILLGVCWAEELGLLVAVGGQDGVDAYIVTSPDGITWTERANPKNVQLNEVIWTGSLLVAVGGQDGTDAYVITSPDGITWTERANPKNFALTGVVWTGSLLVAVGASDGTDAYIVTSPDGITWTERANPKNFTLLWVEWTGSLLVAVGSADGTDAYIVTSPDGITWTERANPKNFVLNAVCWAEELGLLVAVGGQDGTDAYVITSPDGITWTERANPKNVALSGMVWTGSLLVAVGSADGTDAYVITSPDGITWTERANPKNFTLFAICWTGSLLVAVGSADGTDAYIVTSPADTSLKNLIPFIGSTGNPYMMELGHLYIRFWRHDIFRNPYRVESSPGTALEVATPWAANDLATLQFAQANDVMYLTHPSYTPRKLTRTGEASFTLTNLMDPTTPTVNRNTSTFKLWDGPYLSENSTLTTLTLSGTGTGSKTLTASSSLFASTDVGRLVRIFSEVDGSKIWGWGIITAFTNATTVTIFMVEDPSTTSAETRWMLGAWSATTGYPNAVAFYQQRLVFGQTEAEPMRFWPSVPGDFEAFDPTSEADVVLADNGAALTIASRQMLPIQWLEAGQDLYAGTKGGVFRIDGGEGLNDVGPLGARVRLAAGYGAAAVLPALVGDVLIYLQEGKRIVRGLSPQVASDVLSQPDLTLLAEHVTQSGVEEMVFASTPSSIVWMRRADGVLIGMTLNPVTRLLAWHRHPFPGSLTGSTYPKVLSIAVLPIAGHDQLWCITRRTVNGADVDHLEAMGLPFDSTAHDQEDACYLDAAVKYDGPATTAISGLDHLEGESVYAYADGIVQGPYTVSSGAITLGTAASAVWVGLDYESLSPAETLPVRMVEAQNAKVGVISTMVEVLDTNGLQLGIDAADLGTLTNLQDVETYVAGTLKPLVTGDREHVLPRNTTTRRTILFYPEGPLPATIVGLTHMVNFDHV